MDIHQLLMSIIDEVLNVFDDEVILKEWFLLVLKDHVKKQDYINLHLTKVHENELMVFVDYLMINEYYKLAKDD